MRIAISIAALVFSCAQLHGSDEWPQFRGPGGQGHSDAKGLPLTWSETENVKWKTAIPGEGWSSPVISGKQVWMTTALNLGKSLHAVCVDFETGKIVHDVEVFAVEAPPAKHALNSFASPTPVIEGDRVYVCFGTCGTACLSTSTAKVIWKNEELKIDHQNASGSSPMIYKDKLFLCCDGIDVQYMAALNKNDGKLAWKTDRSQPFIAKTKDMKKSYAIPLVIQVDGKDQLITPAAENLYAYDPETGKELWYVKYPGFSNVPRPIFGHGMLYVCTGFYRAELWAIKPGGSGNLTASNVAWKNKIQVPTQPSPLLIGDHIYMVSDSGMVSCLNAKTGVEIWKQHLAGEYSASPIFAEGRNYFFDRKGLATVIEPAETYKELAKNQLEAGFMASPAVSGKALVLRTKTSLYRIEK